MNKWDWITVGGEPLTCPIADDFTSAGDWRWPEARTFSIEANLSEPVTLEMEYYMNRFGRVYLRGGGHKIVFEPGVEIIKENGFKYGDMVTVTIGTK